MSGQEFINFLDEIGFPNSNELDADSFDWMFDNQETRDFMQWLCQDLTTENLITPEEISRFEQLKSSGGLVLDNESLEEALMIERSKNSMFIDDHLYADDPSKRIEAVKKQIEETESQIRSVKKRKNLLTKQRNILEEHRSSIIEKQAKLEKASKIAGSEYEREISNVKAADQSYDEAINYLLPALDNLMTHYKQFGSEHNHTLSSVMTTNLNLFLSQVSLDRLQKQDDEFLRELSNYAKHLFSTSSNVNMTEEDTMKSFAEGCFNHLESSFLSNSVRKNLDCKSSAEFGDSENLVTRQQEELQMMQEIMSSYQMKFIKAVTKETENRALQNFLTLNMGDIKFSFIPEDPNLMRETHFHLEKELKALTDDIRDLLSNIILKQCKRIGSLEASNILLRNYESKCSSQKQLLESQTRIIEKLVTEKARKEFLVMALNLEMRDHKEINGVLKTAYNFINNNKMQSDSRIKILEEKLTMSRAQSPSMPILSKETFLHQLNSIITLPSSSSSSVYASKLQLTAEDLLEKCRIVYQKSQSLNLNKKLFNNMAEEGAFILNKEITECLKLFPASCLKPSSLKSLTKQADGFVEFGLAQLMLPQAIVVPMADLDDALQKLEKFVGEMVKELEKKKWDLKSDKFLAEERNLYINFFTNPELFRRQMARIKSRVSQQKTH